MNVFWGDRFEKCYTDIRVFNPLAPSNSGSSLQSTYRKHDSLKKRTSPRSGTQSFYSIAVSLCFTKPLCFKEIIASWLSDKWKEPCVLGWVRYRLSFCLLHSVIQCIRGAHGHCVWSTPVDLIQSETHVINNIFHAYVLCYVFCTFFL